jgi:single-strand DNA-binding protein
VLNKVQIIGRLGQDPETVKEGVVRLSVATTESWKDRETNEKREKTEWHKVTFFGKLAGVASQYLHKGSLVYIEGSLETSRYEKDGATHYSTGIKGRELRMLDGKRAEGGEDHAGEERGGSRAASSKAPASKPPVADPDDFGDVPF